MPHGTLKKISAAFTHSKRAVLLYPCVFLLGFIYLFFIPRVVSYDHCWAITEILYLEEAAFKTGANLNIQDFKNGLNYKDFESQFPRITRPWSSYFQILDAKFRAWLWHSYLPHPSLSLTWIFSLVLSPLFLFLLLKNMGIGINIACAATAFYLLTPTHLSHVTELFRPGKPMADFAIIFCLYLASLLDKTFIQKLRQVPWPAFLLFWGFSALSLFWDETALLIIPAIPIFFPKIFTHRKFYIFVWLLLPLLVAYAYFVIIPAVTIWAGYPAPDLTQYWLFKKTLHVNLANLQKELSLLPLNTKNLVLGTMGILFPDILQAGLWAKCLFISAVFSWGTLFFHIGKTLCCRWPLAFFLAGLVILFNHSMFALWSSIWGAFWYGGFWAIFFTLWLFILIHKSTISKHLLAACLFFILINMFQSFLAVNTVYKKNHYYPYSMNTISKYFRGENRFFSPEDTPRFTTQEIKTGIRTYWMARKAGLTRTESYCLPSELHWLVIELDPEHPSPPLWKQILWKHERKDFIDTLHASDRCLQSP